MILKNFEIHSSLELISLVFIKDFESYQLAFDEEDRFANSLSGGIGDEGGEGDDGISSSLVGNMVNNVGGNESDRGRGKTGEGAVSVYNNYHSNRSIFDDVPRCLLDLFGFIFGKTSNSKEKARERDNDNEDDEEERKQRKYLFQGLKRKAVDIEEKERRKEKNKDDNNDNESDEDDHENYWKPYQIMNYYYQPSEASKERASQQQQQKKKHHQSSSAFSSTTVVTLESQQQLANDYQKQLSIFHNENYIHTIINPNLFDFYFFISQQCIDRYQGMIDYQSLLYCEGELKQFHSSILEEMAKIRYLKNVSLLTILYNLTSELIMNPKRYPRFLLTNLLFSSKVMKYSYQTITLPLLAGKKNKTEESEDKRGKKGKRKLEETETMEKSIENEYLFATVRRSLFHPLLTSTYRRKKQQFGFPSSSNVTSNASFVEYDYYAASLHIHDPPYRIAYPTGYEKYNSFFSGGVIANDRILSVLGPFSYESIFTSVWNLPPFLPSSPSSSIGFNVKLFSGLSTMSALKLAYNEQYCKKYAEERKKQATTVVKEKESTKSQKMERKRETEGKLKEKGVSNEERVLLQVKEFNRKQRKQAREEAKRNSSNDPAGSSWFGGGKRKETLSSQTDDEEDSSDDGDDEEAEEEEDGNNNKNNDTEVNIDDGNLSIPFPYEMELVYFVEYQQSTFIDKIKRSYSHEIIRLIEFMISNSSLLFSKVSFSPSPSAASSSSPIIDDPSSADNISFSLEDILHERDPSSSSSSSSNTSSDQMNFEKKKSIIYEAIMKNGFRNGKCVLSGGMLQLPSYHSQRITFEKLLELFQQSIEKKALAQRLEEEDEDGAFDDIFEFGSVLSSASLITVVTEGEDGEEKSSKRLPSASLKKRGTVANDKEEKERKEKDRLLAQGEQRRRETLLSNTQKISSPSASGVATALDHKSSTGSLFPRKLSNASNKSSTSAALHGKLFGGKGGSSLLSEGGFMEEGDEDNDDLFSANIRFDPTHSDSNRIYRNSFYQNVISSYYTSNHIPTEDFVYVPFTLTFTLIAVKGKHKHPLYQQQSGQPHSQKPLKKHHPSSKSGKRSQNSTTSGGDRLGKSSSTSSLTDNSENNDFIDHNIITIGKIDDLSRLLVSTIWFSKETTDTLWNSCIYSSLKMSFPHYLTHEIKRLQSMIHYYYYHYHYAYSCLEYSILQAILLQYYSTVPPIGKMNDTASSAFSSTFTSFFSSSPATSSATVGGGSSDQGEEEEGKMTFENLLFSLFNNISYKFCNLQCMISLVSSQYVENNHSSQLSLIALERTILQYVDLSLKYLISSPNCLYFQGLFSYSLVLLDYYAYNNKLLPIPIPLARKIESYSPSHMMNAGGRNRNRNDGNRGKETADGVVASSVSLLQSRNRYPNNRRVNPDPSSGSGKEGDNNSSLLSMNSRQLQSQYSQFYWKEKKKFAYDSSLLQLNPYLIPYSIITSSNSFSDSFHLIDNIRISKDILTNLFFLLEMILMIYSKDLFLSFSSFLTYSVMKTKRFSSVAENLELLFPSGLVKEKHTVTVEEFLRREKEKKIREEEEQEKRKKSPPRRRSSISSQKVGELAPHHHQDEVKKEEADQYVEDDNAALETSIVSTLERFLTSNCHQQTQKLPYLHYESMFYSEGSNGEGEDNVNNTQDLMNLLYEIQEEKHRQEQEERDESAQRNAEIATAKLNEGQTKQKAKISATFVRTIYQRELAKWNAYQSSLSLAEEKKSSLAQHLLLKNITKISKLKRILSIMKKDGGSIASIALGGLSSKSGKSGKEEGLSMDQDESSKKGGGGGGRKAFLFGNKSSEDHEEDEDDQLKGMINTQFQSKWKKEKEMEAFLADSLYSKVLNSEGNEKVSYLSTFHDEEKPLKDQQTKQLLQHNPLTNHTFSTSGFSLVGQSLEDFIRNDIELSSVAGGNLNDRNREKSMLSLLRIYGNVQQQQHSGDEGKAGAFSEALLRALRTKQEL
jgi:hypothetical protein